MFLRAVFVRSVCMDNFIPLIPHLPRWFHQLSPAEPQLANMTIAISLLVMQSIHVSTAAAEATQSYYVFFFLFFW
jgi:hypothetical protein